MTIFLATWTAAILLAFEYKDEFASVLPIKLGSEAMQIGLAALLIFLGVLIAGAIINYIFSKIVSAIGLGVFDRILGTGLGIVLGGLGLTLITMLLGMTEIPNKEIWTKSAFIPKFQEAAEWIKSAAPESMSQLIDKNFTSKQPTAQDFITPSDSSTDVPTLDNNSLSTPQN
jgi:membrane protein required for colicin V production